MHLMIPATSAMAFTSTCSKKRSTSSKMHEVRNFLLIAHTCLVNQIFAFAYIRPTPKFTYRAHFLTHSSFLCNLRRTVHCLRRSSRRSHLPLQASREAAVNTNTFTESRYDFSIFIEDTDCFQVWICHQHSSQTCLNRGAVIQTGGV